MGMGDRGWSDRAENYADGYTRMLDASTADNIIGIDTKRPVVVYSVNFTASQANASGEFVLVDGSATADSGDTRRARFVVASGVTTDRNLGSISAVFPRGMTFESGLIVSAATCTGALTLTYKARYP